MEISYKYKEILSDMDITLHNYCKEIESIDNKLRILGSSQIIDVPKIQKKMFHLYENNPVLYDAIKGKQSIEDSLEELGSVNKGIRKILPWRKDKAHNERIKQIRELISEPAQLKTSGILIPDNFITTVSEVAAVMFGAFYLMEKFLPLDPSLSPEALENLHQMNHYTPIFVSSTLGPIFGALENRFRFRKLPLDEAKYLDEKVKEFYHLLYPVNIS